MASSIGIRYGLQTVTVACIGAAYLLAGQWFILPALALLAIGWFLFQRSSIAGASRWLLAGAIGLAVIAAMMHLSMILIVIGVVAAVAAWDLADFDAVVQACARPVDRSRLVGLHTKWLVLALGSGMFLALLASIGSLQLPFAVAAALALILVASLTRAAQQLMGARRR
jgi:hypothetical protein